MCTSLSLLIFNPMNLLENKFKLFITLLHMVSLPLLAATNVSTFKFIIFGGMCFATILSIDVDVSE